MIEDDNKNNELEENPVEIEALNELIRLPYYKGIFEDIIEIKFA